MRLAQLSDTHLLADPTATLWGHDTTRNLGAVMDALPRRIDVLVVTGDIAEDGDRDAYRRALAMTDVGAGQRHFIPGNHDDPGALSAVIGSLPALRMERLSDRWTLALVDSQWLGHEAGRIGEATLVALRHALASEQAHVALCLHHPPVSPCPNEACGLSNADEMLEVIRDSPVRAVMSGHVHQHFDVTIDGIRFLGAPSTFRQLRHGGDPHYQDRHEPPAAQLVELLDDGTVDCRLVEVGRPVRGRVSRGPR